MRYLITSPNFQPFLTAWYDYENNYQPGMIIYDLAQFTFSTDGINFKELSIDSL